MRTNLMFARNLQITYCFESAGGRVKSNSGAVLAVHTLMKAQRVNLTYNPPPVQLLSDRPFKFILQVQCT